MTCDFSLAHYRELLHAVKQGGYRFAAFDHAPEPGDLFLRHDVDLSLDAALTIAELEASEDAWSTWFLMRRSVFYNLESPQGDHAIARLRELGHRVAQHAVYPAVDVDPRFDRVVSWHNPDPGFMQLEVDGQVNVMRAPFFDPDHYRSDSNHNWRHGCPHEQLARGEFEWLQLLTHPAIWAYEGASMRESMEAMLDADRAARFEHLQNDRIDLS